MLFLSFGNQYRLPNIWMLHFFRMTIFHTSLFGIRHAMDRRPGAGDGRMDAGPLFFFLRLVIWISCRREEFLDTARSGSGGRGRSFFQCDGIIASHRKEHRMRQTLIPRTV